MGAMTQTAGRQEAGLLASAAAGDEVAFRRIIAAHHEDMRRVCLAISSDDAIADEAVEAAWVIAWRKLGKVRGPAQLRPWLVTVAVNETRQLLRKRRRRTEAEMAAGVLDDITSIDPATGIASVDLRAALLRLDPDDRALLVMRYGAGLDSTELALATGRTPAAIRQRLKRLVDRLREDLSDG
jgi:RNA polymerase sigma-70 factor (ECF subfamily)